MENTKSMREEWLDHGRTFNTSQSFLIPSPLDPKKSVDDYSREGIIAGTKAAAITCVVTTVPTLAFCRVVPWAKANLNYTAQALIISTASIAAYFITADKTILKRARGNAEYEKKT